jgi:hypothetical protein
VDAHFSAQSSRSVPNGMFEDAGVIVATVCVRRSFSDGRRPSFAEPRYS